jgi:hypothetical protein
MFVTGKYFSKPVHVTKYLNKEVWEECIILFSFKSFHLSAKTCQNYKTVTKQISDISER